MAKYENPLNLTIKGLKTWDTHDGGGYQFSLYQGPLRVAFVHRGGDGGSTEVQWFDPMSSIDGKEVDPATYGISPAGAQAIRQHNKVVFGAGEPKPKRIPLTTPELVAAVANMFIENLCEQIGTDNMMKVRARNAMAQYDGACASHDFCDANVCMMNAVGAIVGVGEMPDESDPFERDQFVAWSKMVSAAWDLARACQFRMPFMLEFLKHENYREYHTITFFSEGPEFDINDLFAVNDLRLGQSYYSTTKTGHEFRVTRIE